MKKLKIVVSAWSFCQNASLCQQLRQSFSSAEICLAKQPLQPEELPEFVHQADAWLVGREPITAQLLDQCPNNLKIIAKYGVGLDNIDQPSCKQRGIHVGYLGGTNALSVAEMTLGFLLSLAHNLFWTSNALKNGQWQKHGGVQLCNKRIGIIGLGFVGKQVARLLQPFQCQILANDILDQKAYCQQHGIEFCTQDHIFNTADFISLHTPLTKLTQKMVTAERLKQMKPGACLINTARGEIVDQKALADALNQQKLGGVALDVYTLEPPTDLGFLNHPKLICTPHIGGNAKEAVQAMGQAAIDQLKQFYGS